MSTEELKRNRYYRIYDQLNELFLKTKNPLSRMATIVALLHNKIPYFYWTGFYFLNDEELTVGPYQGTLACLVLPKNTGVCWSCINQKEAIIVPNVHSFPGHIACDSRSKSEIVIPLFKEDNIIGVLDVDSLEYKSFDQIDSEELTKIITLIND